MNELSPARRDLTVALVGNPNSGKTALFNALTGSRQKVANYAGVTVERKEGTLTTPAGRPYPVLDLPGTYSLRARSPDEAVTRDVVLGRLAGEARRDVVVCVADATNLRLVLRLVLELKRSAGRMLLALNMIDIAQHRGIGSIWRACRASWACRSSPPWRCARGGIDELLAEIDRRWTAARAGSLDLGLSRPTPAAARAPARGRAHPAAAVRAPDGPTPDRQARRGAAAPGGRA